jgi:membrane-bound serine protease (ClpP class)
LRAVAIACLVLAFGVGPAAADQLIVTCDVSGIIDEGIAIVVNRAIAEAERNDASAVIFKVDTPGGRVDSAIEIATAIQETKVTTIAFIEGMGAISAGALISYACDHMVMTPGTNIGAATPVIPTPQGMQPTSEKEVSFVRAKMRALAESNDYNADIAQAMVDEDIELRSIREEDGSLRIYSVSHEPSPGDDTGELVRPVSPIERIFRTLGEDMPFPTEPPSEGDDPAGEESEDAAEGAVPATVVEPGTVVFEDGSELVLPKGKLLTLTPKEAIRFGLIPKTMDSVEEAAEHYGLTPATYTHIIPTWSEDLFRWLTSPTVAGLLMLLALGGLYFEVQTPGFGLPGIVGITCLVLLLGSHYVVGLADIIDLVLILSGIILICLEIFVFPGFGLAGGAGIVCLVTGLYLSLVNFTFPRYSWEFDRLNEVLYSFGLAIGLFAVFAVATWRFMPRAAMSRWIVQGGTQAIDAGYTVQPAERVQSAIGLRGVATSMLRPAGRGRFGDTTYQVVARGDYLEPGAPIKIVEVSGNRYVVDRIEETNAS